MPLNDYLQWWSYVKGANWRHPSGPDSNSYMPVRYRNQTIMYWISNAPYDIMK